MKLKLQKVPELLKSLKLRDTIDQVTNEASDLRLVRAQRQRLIHQVDLVPYLSSLREIAREGVVRDLEEDWGVSREAYRNTLRNTADPVVLLHLSSTFFTSADQTQDVDRCSIYKRLF